MFFLKINLHASPSGYIILYKNVFPLLQSQMKLMVKKKVVNLTELQMEFRDIHPAFDNVK